MFEKGVEKGEHVTTRSDGSTLTLRYSADGKQVNEIIDSRDAQSKNMEDVSQDVVKEIQDQWVSNNNLQAHTQSKKRNQTILQNAAPLIASQSRVARESRAITMIG
jgi:hypothetical protein